MGQWGSSSLTGHREPGAGEKRGREHKPDPWPCAGTLMPQTALARAASAPASPGPPSPFPTVGPGTLDRAAETLPGDSGRDCPLPARGQLQAGACCAQDRGIARGGPSTTPVCRPAAPACGGGCSPAPGTPPGSGHWALGRDTLRSVCVAVWVVPTRLQTQPLLPGLSGAGHGAAGCLESWASEQQPRAAAKCHRRHARNAKAGASPRWAAAAAGELGTAGSC